MTPPLVDTHCHLAFEAFDPDRAEVVARAREAGVAACVVVAVDHGSTLAARRLAAAEPGWAWPTAGIHPTEPAVADPEEWARVATLLAGGGFIAVGETGLDAFHRSTRPEDQLASLRRHLAAALELDLPVILHCRDAFAPLRAELSAWSGRGLRGVLHCFTGDAADAAHLLELGLHLGLGGATTYKGNAALRDAVRDVSPERIVLETDAPWLAPLPRRGRRNEPAFVAHVAEALARDRGMATPEFARRTTATAGRLFGLPGSAGR